MISSKEYMEGLVAKARVAQKLVEEYNQNQVDELCEAVSYACIDEKFRRKAAKLLMQEAGMGNEEDKFEKIRNKSMSVYHEMKGEKSVGIIAEDKEKQLVTYIKPMGVVGAIIPVTNGESTPVVKTLWALKSRNALILSPHRKAKKTARFIVSYIQNVLVKMGAPKDLIQCIEEEYCGRETAAEMMRQCDFVVATGGSGLVKAAYSSGTPAIGVGAGNATVYIDTSADISDLTKKLRISQSFDNSSSCSSENNLICHESVYERFLLEASKAGAYVIRNHSREKEQLVKTLWPEWPENDTISRNTPAQSAVEIARLAGIKVPENTVYILLEEDGYGEKYVTTGEKLCPVVTLLKASDFSDALKKMEAILDYQGKGHSCGIFTENEEQIQQLAQKMKVARILVNQAQSMGNAGAYFNGMASTNSLGCGTWGGNSSCKNITWRDLTNTTTVSRFLPDAKPLQEEEVYSDKIRKYNFSDAVAQALPEN